MVISKQALVTTFIVALNYAATTHAAVSLQGNSRSIASSNCTLTLSKRTASAKGFYAGQQPISDKIAAALKEQCDIKVRLMTLKEQIQFEKTKSEKRIQKLEEQASLIAE